MDEGREFEVNGDYCGYRDLAAAVVLRAIRDIRRGQPCNGYCRPSVKVHCCAADAWQFLTSDEGQALLMLLDLDVEAVLAALGPKPEGEVVRQLELF